MKTLIIILLLFVASYLQAQTIIGSKSYIKSYNVANLDTSVLFKPTGYADYAVKPTVDGAYNFVVRVMNNNSKGILAYIWSPATGAWSNTYMAVKTGYQNIPVKATMNTGTSYIRLYFADSATVDNITYTADVAPTVDLQPLIDRITKLEKRLDTLPTLYIQQGYGTTEANPIRP
jgi:hypothetical protein